MNSDRPPAFFIAEHPALDFLNTVATPQDVTFDWLTDGSDLLDWLEQAQLIEPAAATKFRKLDRRILDDVARQAREFRQWLQTFITHRMGKPIRATLAALGPLNELLAAENSFQLIEARGRDDEDGRGLLLRRVHRWKEPQELLQPIANAAADLICRQDFRLIRSCEGSRCTLLFLDRTKAHSRRWCSMAICGNRAKAAAFRSRKGTE